MRPKLGMRRVAGFEAYIKSVAGVHATALKIRILSRVVVLSHPGGTVVQISVLGTAERSDYRAGDSPVIACSGCLYS